MILLTLISCDETPGNTPPDDPPVASPSDTDSPTSETPPWTSGTTELPALPVAEIEVVLTDLIAAMPGMDLTPIHTAYDAIMAQGSPQCPFDYYPSDNYDYWFTTCTAPSGASFTGYVLLSLTQAPEYRYWYDALSATMTGADGVVLETSGVFTGEKDGTGAAFVDWVDTRYGSVSYDGPEVAGTWLGDGLEPELYLERTVTGADTRLVFADGMIGGFEGSVDQVEWVDVSFDSSVACDEPAGTVSIRTVDGDWFDITYDQVTCDGCGDALWLGLSVGTICADYTPWTDFELSL